MLRECQCFKEKGLFEYYTLTDRSMSQEYEALKKLLLARSFFGNVCFYSIPPAFVFNCSFWSCLFDHSFPS